MNTPGQTQPITDSIARHVIRLALTVACLSLPLTGYAAATYIVGTCQSGKAAFATIQQAVTTVPAGSTIDVCPGNYPEWVYITRPLTLQGIQSGNSSAATITVPTSSPSNILYGLVAAQVLVVDPGGPVNLSGITIDGTGFPALTPEAANIVYDSASGTLDNVVAQSLNTSSASDIVAGILLRDDSSVLPTVTVKNSVVNISAGTPSATTIGIYVPYVPTVNMTLNVMNTFLSTPAYGMLDQSTGTSTISNNTMPGAPWGILVAYGDNVSITGNTITTSYGASVGVQNNKSTAITGNLLSGGIGILTEDPNVTIKGNQFFPVEGGQGSTGIDFECQPTSAAVSENTFTGMWDAINHVPASTPLKGTAGTYIGVRTIETSCP